ncbi:class I adenylate-forming enzyme family protein [Salinivibrio kushneri]|uniref:Class I adenylate-forming enzyme family protein n=1 Tax=Salinivibrio kushneri TaxID=1908198 RepID=A0AA47KJR3_9GAMM|nr:class I adenylate-forming enzyme family protein [Salinivibrio kushneri]WBA07887.1 class I adenylate-forming enzyme family protein [Salinivibrio kushneri]
MIDIDKILKGDAQSVAIEINELKVSYGELKSKIALMEAFFEENGLTQGKRICLAVDDPLEYYTHLLACFAKGVVVCPLSETYSDNYSDRILSIFRPSAVLKNGQNLILKSWEEETLSPELGSTALVTFTSGTTGIPKGVCHSLDGLIRCCEAFNEHNDLNAKTKMMHVMPRFYMAGILNTFLSPLLAGGTVVISDTFSAQNASVLFKKYCSSKANSIWLSPSMLLLSSKMTRDKEAIAWLSNSNSKVFVGTAPLPSKSKEIFQQKFSCEVLESYGTSELLFISCAKAGEGHTEGVGKPIDGVNISFTDDEEVLVDSPWTMLGYINADGTGRYTGDIGKLDDGHLIITGRKKDLVIKGGQNISPRYIEESALSSDTIEEAAVVAEPHSFWGEVPILYILPNQSYAEKEFRDFLTSRLSKEQYPEKIYVVKSFPKTATGKIVKNAIVRE